VCLFTRSPREESPSWRSRLPRRRRRFFLLQRDIFFLRPFPNTGWLLVGCCALSGFPTRRLFCLASPRKAFGTNPTFGWVMPHRASLEDLFSFVSRSTLRRCSLFLSGTRTAPPMMTDLLSTMNVSFHMAHFSRSSLSLRDLSLRTLDLMTTCTRRLRARLWTRPTSKTFRWGVFSRGWLSLACAGLFSLSGLGRLTVMERITASPLLELAHLRDLSQGFGVSEKFTPKTSHVRLTSSPISKARPLGDATTNSFFYERGFGFLRFRDMIFIPKNLSRLR